MNKRPNLRTRPHQLNGINGRLRTPAHSCRGPKSSHSDGADRFLILVVRSSRCVDLRRLAERAATYPLKQCLGLLPLA
jgi:hypothetical protein